MLTVITSRRAWFRSRTGLQLTIAQLWTYPLWRSIIGLGVAPVVRQDVEWWVECIAASDLGALDTRQKFAYLVGALPEYRTLVHLRLRTGPVVIRAALRVLYRPAPNLVIAANSIGPALFIQHGLATIVTAESIGSHCWINQQVTIGHNNVGRPTLGDRVRVGAGAVVLGPITLHDGATVGANATVTRDVGPGETVVAPLAVPLDRTRPPDAGRDGEPRSDREPPVR